MDYDINKEIGNCIVGFLFLAVLIWISQNILLETNDLELGGMIGLIIAIMIIKISTELAEIIIYLRKLVKEDRKNKNYG